MKQISSILGEELNGSVQTLAIAVAQAQHHDSITGTEKQHVSDDYALYLDEGVTESQKVLTAAYRYICVCVFFLFYRFFSYYMEFLLGIFTRRNTVVTSCVGGRVGYKRLLPAPVRSRNAVRPDR